jgi:hypothetical protein
VALRGTSWKNHLAAEPFPIIVVDAVEFSIVASLKIDLSATVFHVDGQGEVAFMVSYH